MRDAARAVVEFVPGSTELISGIHGLLPPPGEEWLVTAAASLFAALYMLAIIQAILPIGRSEIWSGWRKTVFALLDSGVFFVGLAVALGVRALAANGPAREFPPSPIGSATFRSGTGSSSSS